MTPIDSRGPRVADGVVALALLLAFVGDLRVLVPLLAAVLVIGAVLGPRYAPLVRIYTSFVQPRLRPPKQVEDPRPPRFADAIGAVLLTAATTAFVLDAQVVAWTLALAVVLFGGLAATSGLCVGCELYLFFARRRGVQLVA